MDTRAQALELSLPALREMTDAIIADDEAERFPTEVDMLVSRHGILMEIIPASQNGRLTNIKELLDISRVLSRRNLTAAIAIGQSFLGALPVWIAGTQAQKKHLAAILSNEGLGCLALTEMEHGSDLQGNEVSISEIDADNYRLTGKKWCINNATTGKALCLLVRSHPAGGEQGFSLLFIDKSQLPPTTFSSLPKLITHGIRGADISGIHFDGASIAKSCLVGREGNGLTITFKTLQISRTLCAGFSLGAADTCLRLAMDFALGRELYGKTLTDIDAVATRLTRCYSTLLLCEAAAWTISRACTLLPAQLSIYSSVVKYCVPTIVDQLILDCGVILGARSYLREGDYALFQKHKRDHAVVSLFDGSTDINLYVISGQLRTQFKQDRKTTPYSIKWSDFYSLNVEPPNFEGDGLKVSSRGNDFVWEGLAELLNSDEPAVEVHCRSLLAQHEELKAGFLAEDSTQDQASHASLTMARHYCHATIKAIYLQFWFYNRHNFAMDALKDPRWLNLVITAETIDLTGSASEAFFAGLTHQFRAGLMFSHREFKLSE